MQEDVKLGNRLEAFAEERKMCEKTLQMFQNEEEADEEKQDLGPVLRPEPLCKMPGEALMTALVLRRVAAG